MKQIGDKPHILLYNKVIWPIRRSDGTVITKLPAAADALAGSAFEAGESPVAGSIGFFRN